MPEEGSGDHRPTASDNDRFPAMAYTLTTPPPGRFLAISTIHGRSIVTRKKAKKWLRAGRAVIVAEGIIQLIEADPRVTAVQRRFNETMAIYDRLAHGALPSDRDKILAELRNFPVLFGYKALYGRALS